MSESITHLHPVVANAAAIGIAEAMSSTMHYGAGVHHLLTTHYA